MKRSAYPEALFRLLGNRTVLHVLFWTCLLGVLVLLESSGASFRMRLLQISLFLSFNAAATYIHFFLLSRYLHRRRYLLYFAGLVLTLGTLGVLLHRISSALYRSGGSIFGEIFSLAFFLGFTTALRYARAGVRQKLQLQEITAKQLQTELALLKAQINPHFFFNTLNNLYAMALRQEDPATAQGIAKLSHLMRYVIYESDVDRIELPREVEQIRSFIELQKLRFSEEDDIRIEFEILGDVGRCTIAPMILLPFVENAFKHGIRLSSPSHVSMQLTAKDGAIRFSVENSAHGTTERSAETNSALGLRNVQRRLALMYPDTHHLSIHEGEGVYRVVLDLGSGSSN
jgi:two-component system, LytTR family, sensor kinase